MTHRFAIAGALLALAAAGCHDDAIDEANLIGIDWRLDSIERRRGPALSADGRRYTLAGSSLAVTPLACTRAYCGDESLDPAYPAILQGAREWSLEGDRRLVITAADGTLVFVR